MSQPAEEIELESSRVSANLEDEPLDARLIRLTKTLIDLMNDRQYDDAFFSDHLSTNVYIDYADITSGTGLDTFINNYRRYADQCPEFHVGTCNPTAIVDLNPPGGGDAQATVILSQDLTGYETEERRMSGSILMYWARREGRWVVVSVCMMFGTPEFLPER